MSALNYRPASLYNVANTTRAIKNPVTFLTSMAVVLCLWSIFLRNNLTAWDQESSAFVSSKGQTDKGICFVQSVFGKPGQKSLDKPSNVTSLREESTDYHFFYFTNMQELDTPGWEKVLVTDMKYRRFITQSRYAKFLGWKYHFIAEKCRFVMYLDGHFVPRNKKSLKFRMLAKSTLGSKYGLIQTTHPKGGSLSEEFERIVSGTKDTQQHVDASLEWLQAQPDWYNNATLYWNAVFGTFHHFQRPVFFTPLDLF